MKKVIISSEKPVLDVSKISEYESEHLARATLKAIKRYLKFPGVQEDTKNGLSNTRKERWWRYEYKQINILRS